VKTSSPPKIRDLTGARNAAVTAAALADPDAQPLTSEQLAKFRPAAEVLPASLQAKLGMRRRGPQKDPTKERITIRLSADVLESFRATGPGWQARVNAALREWLRQHRPA
jgi:uncharacterized protein (DUF4415 family)